MLKKFIKFHCKNAKNKAKIQAFVKKREFSVKLNQGAVFRVRNRFCGVQTRLEANAVCQAPQKRFITERRTKPNLKSLKNRACLVNLAKNSH